MTTRDKHNKIGKRPNYPNEKRILKVFETNKDNYKVFCLSFQYIIKFRT